MLTDFDQTLTQLLVQRVPLDPNQVAVSMECPTREWAAKVVKPTVNAYLFDLRQNTTFAKKSGQGSAPLPPTHFDLSYVISVWAPNTALEHNLLWRVMMLLMRETSFAPDLLQGALKGLAPPVPARAVTAQWDGAARRPEELWGALGNPLKPSLTYTATLAVAMRPTPRPAPPVLTKTMFTSNTAKAQKEPLVAIGGIVRTPAPGEGQEGPPPRVIADAEVTFPHLGLTVRSDSDGRYVVGKIPLGAHRVRVVTTGGDRAEVEITVPAPNYNLEVRGNGDKGGAGGAGKDGGGDGDE